ncbi:class I SAM-dependent methyltransferase [Mesorhizobium sp. CAU 1741]|uniref:class I SAM-dependent methyltransferase n=1 Tax=Mesorhizobium sp. CAU 1741 TaxID=3140366 RepID=UPI00325B9171
MNMMAAPPMASVRGSGALARLLEYRDVHRVLDVGSGAGEHAAIMRRRGLHVVTVSYEPPADHVCDYVGNREIGGGFDAIWASHVLEHQPNVNLFLRQCFRDLRPDGVLAVTVPPMKDNVVGGHLTVWNAGILLYNLIIAGFDCRDARVSPLYSSGPGYPPYNISVIVRKRSADLPPLRFDSGDIERLAAYFPCPVQQGFDGRMEAIDW